MKDFLPINLEDMKKRGWEQCDFVYIIGDAYVDHTSFGPAIISRVLMDQGYKVGIISQPDYKDEASINSLKEPRLGFLVSAGNMDTMVNHYTVAKKHRDKDAYTPGGETGKRPDRATIVYCNLIRRLYKKKPIIIGGIEASLRRLGHYDYWSDSVRRSILIDSGADLISYGMGERSIVEIADALASGIAVKDITYVAGTVFRTDSLEKVYEATMLPDFSVIKQDKKEFAKSFYVQYCNTDPFSGKRLVEKYSGREYVVQNPPALPLTESEMDHIYSLPYMRDYHPSYKPLGGIPIIDEVKFSIVSNRGCFGGCSFCALTFHQGRIVQTRSHESILTEAEQMTYEPDFKGYINDVGGPTANFRAPACQNQLKRGVCTNRQCLFPTPCKNLKIDHSDYLALLRKLRELQKVKKVFIRSGIRFDYLCYDKDKTFFRELCEHHISGQLKVAPEHICNEVLRYMGKPEHSVYEGFLSEFKKMNERLHKEQYIIPYLMSSHPGSTLKEAVELAEYLRDMNYMPEQVQDFYPTPSTISTCMYYTGIDPRTMTPVYVPKLPHEKAMQRALIQYRNPKNRALVEEALLLSHREDLIGYDKKCLIRPGRTEGGRKKEAFEKDRKESKKGRSSEKREVWKPVKKGSVKPVKRDGFHEKAERKKETQKAQSNMNRKESGGKKSIREKGRTGRK